MDEVTAEENGTDNERRSGTAERMVRTANNVLKLPSVRKTFLSVAKRWFWTHLTDALGSLSD